MRGASLLCFHTFRAITVMLFSGWMVLFAHFAAGTRGIRIPRLGLVLTGTQCKGLLTGHTACNGFRFLICARKFKIPLVTPKFVSTPKSNEDTYGHFKKQQIPQLVGIIISSIRPAWESVGLDSPGTIPMSVTIISALYFRFSLDNLKITNVNGWFSLNNI